MKTVLAVVLFIMGVVLLAGALEKRRKIQEPRLQRANGVISKITVIGIGRNTHNAVTVEYELDGATQSAQLDTYTTGMHVGDSVEILVDPDQMEKALLAAPTAPLIMSIAGAVFIALGAVMILR